MTNLDFPVVARKEFDIDSVEYVNTFFMDKANDKAYLAQLKQRCDDNGVKSGLIMCDREGALGDADDAARTRAVENHYKWVTAASALGCHSVRVNAQSTGAYGAQLDHAVDGLRASRSSRPAQPQCDRRESRRLVESRQVARVGDRAGGLPNCGTLPDFGNFRITPEKNYDRYSACRTDAVRERRQAKSYEFDAQGNETTIDYLRILKVVPMRLSRLVGIEYEGKDPDDRKGVRQTSAARARARTTLKEGLILMQKKNIVRTSIAALLMTATTPVLAAAPPARPARNSRVSKLAGYSLEIESAKEMPRLPHPCPRARRPLLPPTRRCCPRTAASKGDRPAHRS